MDVESLSTPTLLVLQAIVDRLIAHQHVLIEVGRCR